MKGKIKAILKDYEQAQIIEGLSQAILMVDIKMISGNPFAELESKIRHYQEEIGDHKIQDVYLDSNQIKNILSGATLIFNTVAQGRVDLDRVMFKLEKKVKE